MGKLLQQISHDLLIPMHDLEYLARSAPYRYKVYEIEKRQPGQKRTIAQPSREVKRLQYWLIKNLLEGYPVHSAAIAYCRGKSILNNAKAHAKKRYLLKLDFKDFFHSIKATDFERLIRESRLQDIDDSDIVGLTRILFWRRARGGELILSIGAPSSPILSNILLYEFDRRVTEFCKPVHITYTRYADDLTFSTNGKDRLKLVEGEIARMCRDLPYPKLKLNAKKTVHASKAVSRRVTGLVLSNDGFVSIGHERKRQLHAAVYRYKHGRLSQEEITALSGMLAFVHSIEPKFLYSLARRYGKDVVSMLLKGSLSP
jgi:retron-type reverse transcriptase